MNAPNIILIMTDNQQAATLGCYGNTEVQTPNLDALAASGIRFDKAFCPNAFCSPCRASTLTGMMPSQHGVHSWIDDRRSDDWPAGWHALAGISTLPERLQRAGYRTGHFGKYHLGETTSVGPGWDKWVAMRDGHVRSFYDNKITEDGDAEYDQPGHAVDFFTDKAIEFIARQAGPYFAYIPFPAPYGHWPATNDGNRNRHAGTYDNCPVETVPRQALSDQAVANYNMVRAQSTAGLNFDMLMRAPNHLPTLRNYYSQITMIDDAVGRLMKAAPDALIVFTADHGLSLGHHGFWGHGASTYPSNLHLAAHSIPLIAARPGHVPIGENQAMLSNTDLFATLLDYGGAAPAEGLPSRSFAPLLRGEALNHWGEDAVFAEQEETRVIRTRQWAFFKRFREPGAPDLPDALYDTVADPGETVDLAQDPAHAATVADLSSRIDAFFGKHARAEADLWRGGQPVQNSMMRSYWQDIWGEAWQPVYRYD